MTKQMSNAAKTLARNVLDRSYEFSDCDDTIESKYVEAVYAMTTMLLAEYMGDLTQQMIDNADELISEFKNKALLVLMK